MEAEQVVVARDLAVGAQHVLLEAAVGYMGNFIAHIYSPGGAVLDWNIDSGAVNMIQFRARNEKAKPDGRAVKRAFISTELFNDFKAQAANFKSSAARD